MFNINHELQPEKKLFDWPSSSDPTTTYRIFRTVEGRLHCSCPDHTYRMNDCKHMRAYRQYEKMLKRYAVLEVA